MFILKKKKSLYFILSNVPRQSQLKDLNTQNLNVLDAPQSAVTLLTKHLV